MMMPWHWPHRIEKSQSSTATTYSVATSTITSSTSTDSAVTNYLFELHGARMHQREQREAAARLGEMLKDES